MFLLSSDVASGHVHFSNFRCVHKEGHVAGQNHCLGRNHKRVEMARAWLHEEKFSVQDPEVSCTPANSGTASCHRDPRAKSFSLKKNTDVTSRLMKPRGLQKRITTTMRFERWVHLPLPPQICVLTVHLLELCSVFSTSLTIHNDYLAPSIVLPSVQSWRYRW